MPPKALAKGKQVILKIADPKVNAKMFVSLTENGSSEYWVYWSNQISTM